MPQPLDPSPHCGAGAPPGPPPAAMLRLARKSVMAHKRRLIGTGLSVIIGIAFLAGTFVFTDTIKRTFDNLFADVFKNTDVYVRSNQSIESDFGQTQRPRIPDSLIAEVQKVPGVTEAAGTVQGYARIIGKDGKPLGSDQGPPNFGGEFTPGALSPWKLADGRAPNGANEVVLDRSSFKDGKFALGDPVTIISQGGSQQFTIVGNVRFGDTDSPGGATFALFDLPTAEAFVARVRRSNATPFTIVPAGEPAIAIVDPDAGIWWQPADAAATVPGSLRVPDLATRLLVAGVEYLDLEADSDQAMPGTQGTPQRLEALLWHLGVQATPGEALRPVARRSTFRLTRWPDFGSIGGNDLLALKLAALLVNRPHRLDQVVTASRAPRGAIIDILNACALCDLLAAETPMASTLTPSSSSSPTAPPAASRYGLVLHALRSALGIGRS